MMKFKLLSGKYRDGGKTYCGGDIVKSNRDLVKIFKNKFECVKEETGIGSRRTKSPETSAKPKALRVVERLEGEGFDVVNEAGDLVNDNPLSEKQANAMVKGADKSPDKE